MGKLLMALFLVVIASLTLAMEATGASQTEEGFLCRRQKADLDWQQEANPMLRREQIEAMDRAMMKRFVDKSIEFIRINFPDWSSDKSDEALTEFINSMTTFAQGYNIRKEINVQRVMEYKITFDFSIPLPPRLAKLLNRDDLAEEGRLELLVWHLEDTSPLIELTLEDASEGTP